MASIAERRKILAVQVEHVTVGQQQDVWAARFVFDVSTALPEFPGDLEREGRFIRAGG